MAAPCILQREKKPCAYPGMYAASPWEFEMRIREAKRMMTLPRQSDQGTSTSTSLNYIQGSMHLIIKQLYQVKVPTTTKSGMDESGTKSQHLSLITSFLSSDLHLLLLKS